MLQNAVDVLDVVIAVVTITMAASNIVILFFQTLIFAYALAVQSCGPMA